MPQRLVQILYTFEFVDQQGDFEDCVYMRENVFMNYDDTDTTKRIVQLFLEGTDKSKRVKNIKEVRNLGLRLI